ncbi:MAG TPA: hypothetical protein VFW33_24240, partial [Gemmataceae bacterium]|nr:hypothetical protein [Gemmataceae bacterium]
RDLPDGHAARRVLKARDRLGWSDVRDMDPAVACVFAVLQSSPSVPGSPTPAQLDWRPYELLRGVLCLGQAERTFRLGGVDDAAVWLNRALPYLQAGPSPSRWLARWSALSARVAWLRGQDAAARKRQREAANVYRQLGNEAAARALAVGKDDAVGESALAIHVAADGEGVTVETRFGTWEERRRLTGPESGALGAAMGPDFLEFPDALAARLVADHAALGGELLRLALPGVSETAAGAVLVSGVTRPLDVSVSCATPALAALPWEFLWLPKAGRPLALDPAARHFHRTDPGRGRLDPAVGQTRALVVRASAGAPGPQAAYQAQGFDVHTLDNPDFDALRSTYQRLGAAVVHLCGPAKYSASAGAAYLDLADPNSPTTTPTLFTASELRVALFPVPGGPRPTVVFDSPRGVTPDETGRQLVRRNALAAEFYASATTAAVLATGLGRPADHDRVYAVLAKCLAREGPAGEIGRTVRALALTPDPARGGGEPGLLARLFRRLLARLGFRQRQRLPSGLEDLLPFVATAVFTNDPAAPAFVRPRPEPWLKIGGS